MQQPRIETLRPAEAQPPNAPPAPTVVYVIRETSAPPPQPKENASEIRFLLRLIVALLSFLALCIGAVAAWHYPEHALGFLTAVVFLYFLAGLLRLASIGGVRWARWLLP